MKSRILASVFALIFLLSACSHNNNTHATAYLYAVINNGNHFTGRSYENVIVGGTTNAAYTTAQSSNSTNRSIDTMQVTGAGLSTDIVSDVSYTINVNSYLVSNNNPVGTIYRGTATVTLSPGETKYVSITTN